MVNFKFREPLQRAKVTEFTKPCSLTYFKGDLAVPGEVYDWGKSDAGDLAAHCFDEDKARASAAVRYEAQKFGAYSPPNEDAVYIVDGGDGRYKVGYSCNPASRLYQMQVGCPQKLNIAGMLWSLSGNAGDFEHYFHAALRDRMPSRGEWFEGSPLEIGLVIGAVAKERGWPLSDSEMYLRHRQMVRHVIRFEEKSRLPEGDPIIFAETPKAA